MYRPRQGLVYRAWSRYIYIYRQYIFICLRNYLTFSTKGTIIYLFCLDLHCILVITLFDNEHEVQCFVSYEFSFKNGLHSSLIINIKIFFLKKYLNNTLLILVILHKIVIDLNKDWDEIFRIRKNNFYFFYKITSCNKNHGIRWVAFGIWALIFSIWMRMTIRLQWIKIEQIMTLKPGPTRYNKSHAIYFCRTNTYGLEL